MIWRKKRCFGGVVDVWLERDGDRGFQAGATEHTSMQREKLSLEGRRKFGLKMVASILFR